MRGFALSVVSFLALVLTAIALIPLGAHVFEMAGKMKLGRDAYFVVQGLYRGWAWFGVAIIGALIACLARAWLLRAWRDRLISLFAALTIAASLATFFAFVHPANRVTKDWTAMPANWKSLRQQWEWGHAGSAALTFSAFLALAWSAVTKRDG